MEENYEIWTEGLKKPKYPKLAKQLEADVTIIGGGITGVVTAYMLSKLGKKVALVEKKELGSSATDATTAFITQSIDTDSKDLIKMFGFDKAKKIYESHGEAILLIEKIVEKEKIDCGFMRCSDYIFAVSDKEGGRLFEEIYYAEKLGLNVRHKSDDKLGFKNHGYIELKNQAKFHPMKYLYALAEIAINTGTEIFENTEALKIMQNGSYHTVTPEGVIKSKWVIVATYNPFNNPFKLYFKKATYTSYVMELKINKNILAEGIFEDMENPYHYFRVDKIKGGQRVFLGGEDHRSDIKIDPSRSYKALESYARRIFRDIDFEIVRRWSGPILEPVDGIPFIGAIDDSNVLYAMGFSGNGMTYSAIAGSILSDLIAGLSNPWDDLYWADRRVSTKSLLLKARDFTQEFWNGAVKTYLKHRKT